MFGKLLILFIAIPVIELYLFMTLGKAIGVLETLGIIVVTAILGAWLTKKQGARAMARFQQATAEGRLPHEEVLDGVMILIAGVVLLTPGFLTDAIGFSLLIPPVRAVLRKRLGKSLKDRVQIVTPSGSTAAPRTKRSDDGVIEVEAEVIDD